MPVPLRAAPVRARTATRLAGVVLALAVAGTGCGSDGGINTLPAPPAAPPGQPAGTFVVPADGDVGEVVQRVRDAITAAGGTTVTVIDHAADANAAGARVAPTTEVIGGPPADAHALLRVDQRAGANLPQHYLVRRSGDGTVSVTANTADYVAAVSGVGVPEARTALRDTTAAVLDAAAPGAPEVFPAPLVGVSPASYLITTPATGGDVAAVVDRLRRAADRNPTRTVAVLDLAAGSAQSGPPVRPTTLVLVGLAAADGPLLAAAPTFGIDLPMRFLVWLDEQNVPQVGYPDVRKLAARHGVAPEDPNVVRLATEAERLARVAVTAPTATTGRRG